MKRLGLVSIASVALASGAAGAAQERSDKVRIDEFAPAAQAQPTTTLGQIATSERTTATEQQLDRTVATAQPHRTPASQAVVQVGAGTTPAPLTQVAPASDRSPFAGPAISRREDGKPTGTAALGGADRCDPRAQDAAERALCRRILELRAREFTATEAPVLSPEQQLLAQQQVAGASISEAGTYARVAENADDRLSQELGFLALSEPVPADRSASPSDTPANDSLLEALKGVLVQMGVPQ